MEEQVDFLIDTCVQELLEESLEDPIVAPAPKRRLNAKLERFIKALQEAQRCFQGFVPLGEEENVLAKAWREFEPVIPAVKEPPPRPTHFLSLRIPSRDIWEAAVRIQQEIVGACPNLKNWVVPARDLHITLFVFPASNEARLKRATEAFAACSELLQELKLTFVGLDTFRGQVLFIAPKHDEYCERLSKFAEQCHDVFAEHGVVPKEEKLSFTPHATLMKSSKDKKRRKGKSGKLHATLLEPWKNFEFGTVEFASLDLSSMMQKDESGYYLSLASLPLNDMEGAAEVPEWPLSSGASPAVTVEARTTPNSGQRRKRKKKWARK